MSFFKKIVAWFAKLGSNSTSIINDMHTAGAAIQLVTPGLVFALQQANVSGVATQVNTTTNEVITDLAVVSQLLAQAQTSSTVPATLGSQIIATLNSIKSNLAGLLAAGHIKDTATVTLVTNATDAFIAEADVVIGMLPTTAA